MRTTSHKVSPRSGTHSLVIPAALTEGLPNKGVWDIEVTDTGYSLAYIGEGTRKPPKPTKVELPFLAKQEKRLPNSAMSLRD